jgi:hypothetical protein
MISRTYRHGSTLVSSTAKLNAPVSMALLMGRTRCSEQRWRKFTRNRQLERAVQLLLGHTKLESTVRYLGIEDALSISEQVEL